MTNYKGGQVGEMAVSLFVLRKDRPNGSLHTLVQEATGK